MAKRKAKEPPDPKSIVPEYIQQSHLLKRRRITKRKLPSYTEAMLLLHAPEALRLFWKAVMEGLDSRDKEALRMTGEMFGYVEKRGINIIQQMQLMQQNNNAAVTDQMPARGFDALVRRIAEERAGHALPAPDDVITVTAEEVVRPAESAAAGD